MDTNDLAKQIYALKVVLTPHWDMQKLAREAVEAATHFVTAIEEKPGQPALEPPIAPPPPSVSLEKEG